MTENRPLIPKIKVITYKEDTNPTKLLDDQKSLKEQVEISYNLFVAFFFFTSSLIISILFSPLAMTYNFLNYLFFGLTLFGLIGYYILFIIFFAYILSKFSKKVRDIYSKYPRGIEYSLVSFGIIFFSIISFFIIGRDVALLILGCFLALVVSKIYSYLDNRNKKVTE